MSKADWSKAPEWARWYAVDEDGEAYWYENKPEVEEYSWQPHGGRVSSVEVKVESWKDTLEERPFEWSSVAVDTPILVRDRDSQRWMRRHFAKYEDGKVYAWDSGCTSFTAGVDTTDWEQAKLYKEGDSDE